MKKLTLLSLVAVLLFSGISFAKGYGHGSCIDKSFGGSMGMQHSFPDISNPEKKKFHQETLAIRQELSQKRFELEKELLSEHPDNAKVESIKKEMAVLKDKVLTARKNANFTKNNCKCNQ